MFSNVSSAPSAVANAVLPSFTVIVTGSVASSCALITVVAETVSVSSPSSTSPDKTISGSLPLTASSKPLASLTGSTTFTNSKAPMSIVATLSTNP